MLSSFLVALSVLASFQPIQSQEDGDTDLKISYETAERLASLPLTCYNQEYPHKFGITYSFEFEQVSPRSVHPVFFGCFDWHSAVHGHWLLAAILNRFPDSILAEQIVTVFDEQFTVEKVTKELEIFDNSANKGFERTYGWAWLLKLQQELEQSPLDEFKGYSKIVKPLADVIVLKYKEFLPKLVYPQRVGTHTNSAFGLIFAQEYAQSVEEDSLLDLIRYNATNHFSDDKNCPLSWEPSGSDFLSPCLQEADLTGRIARDQEEFYEWFQEFLPQALSEEFDLEPGKVIDRTDGHLVHLDGVNFSRAWNFYSLVTKLPLKQAKQCQENCKLNLDELKRVQKRFMALADKHVRTSMEFVVGSDYAGSHWLASFLFYSLQMREQALASIENNH